MIEMLSDWASAYPWGVYALVAIAPFIQEDTAILSAAAASAAGAGSTQLLFITLIIGLSISDLWKYWLGRAAHTHEYGRKVAARPGVQTARDSVINRLGISLVTARFVPGTRIPLYIACGFFKAPFAKVAFFVIISAIIYASIAFILFHKIGEMAGEKLHLYAPIVAICVVAFFICLLIITARRRKTLIPEKTEQTD